MRRENPMAENERLTFAQQPGEVFTETVLDTLFEQSTSGLVL